MGHVHINATLPAAVAETNQRGRGWLFRSVRSGGKQTSRIWNNYYHLILAPPSSGFEALSSFSAPASHAKARTTVYMSRYVWVWFLFLSRFIFLLVLLRFRYERYHRDAIFASRKRKRGRIKRRAVWNMNELQFKSHAHYPHVPWRAAAGWIGFAACWAHGMALVQELTGWGSTVQPGLVFTLPLTRCIAWFPS